MWALASESAQWTTISWADHLPGAGFHWRGSAAVKGMLLSSGGEVKDTSPCPARDEARRDAGGHPHAQPLVEQNRARERIAHADRLDPGERPQLRRPAEDERPLGLAEPRHREGLRARDLEHEPPSEVTRPPHRDPGAVEHDVAELEPVAHLGERERVPVRHAPVADIGSRVAAPEMHRGGAAGIGGPAGGGEREE